MTGQQFICSGTHPTAVRYEWADGLPERIPELTLEQFESLWAALVDGFATAAPVGGALRKRDEMIEGLDDPVAEWLIDKGLVLGEGRDGALYLTCPWIDEHSSDSGLTETAWFPSGSNGYATGAFKCLHAHCDGRTADDFVKAIGYVEASFDVVEVEPACRDGEPMPVDAPKGFVRDKQRPDRGDAAQRHRRCRSRCLDRHRHRPMTSSSKTSSSRPSAPASGDRSRRGLCVAAPVAGAQGVQAGRPGADARHRAWCRHAPQFDSGKLWLDGLKWDGVPRIEKFLSTYFGARRPRLCARRVALLVDRPRRQGDRAGLECHAMPILVGDQGAGKSSALKAMCPASTTSSRSTSSTRTPTCRARCAARCWARWPSSAGFAGARPRIDKGVDDAPAAEQWTPKFMERASGPCTGG
jgi:hypothetical protein